MATFNYSSKSSIKDNLTEILVGAGLIIVPVVYPFGIKVGTLRILGPLPTAIILALVGLYMLFRAWRKIHKARKLAAKSCIITVDGDKVTYPVIGKEMLRCVLLHCRKYPVQTTITTMVF